LNLVVIFHPIEALNKLILQNVPPHPACPRRQVRQDGFSRWCGFRKIIEVYGYMVPILDVRT
jgi:hypothetical protein